MERPEDILEELEKDQEEHLLDTTVEEALNLQVADEEALEAVEKVAHVAQSSLRRLQQVVKEKDELIVVLQEAVSAAHKAALDQHESDQNDLGLLHQLLLTQEDRSVQGITYALQTVVSQQPLSGNSLAGQVARLFDQYLHEISIKHEQETEDLQRSVAMLHNRCQELEESLDHEKRKAKCYLNAQLDEKVAVYSNKLLKSQDLVEELKRQLSKVCLETHVCCVVHSLSKLLAALPLRCADVMLHPCLFKDEKEEQLGVYDNTVRELERLLEEEKDRESNLSLEHERICEEARRSLGQVSSFGQQLQKLKDQTFKFKRQEHEHEHQVRELLEKVTGQKDLIHKLSIQLAALRKKSNIMKPPPEFKEAETAHETQNLQDSLSELRAHISFLERELREARKENSDDSIITYSEDIIVKEETRLPMGLVPPQIVQRLEDTDKLTRKVEILQKNLKATRRELLKRENDMSMATASVQQLRQELRNSKEMIEQLREKKRKMMDSVKKRPTDNVRLKGLLENIEALEMENAVLKHEVMVQKNRRIANLERELRRVQGLDLLIDGKQHSCSRAVKFSDESTAEKVKKNMEDIIANKESMILELKFEADQATWKLAQVEKRFSILYGALECKKIELNAPAADSLLDNIFSSGSGELSISALNLLREKVLHLRGFSRSGSRERELQDLAEAMIKVVEKLNSENEKLKQSCEDTVKHMEKNRKLRKVMHDLQNNDTGKVAGNSEHLMETGIISGRTYLARETLL
ncbi:hypothetical protein R1sor_015884 [Riccia sorocarpa]|uniref:Uncharacterized protein n=1 Tax=Riccia sorocarpa TaxID=122646 RepID=A0ABD3HGW5_9MARC